MRYALRFLCVCAVGAALQVGCDLVIFEGDCPGGCYDSNECTSDDCVFLLGCVHDPVNEGRNCSSRGVAGVCLDGVCDHCAGVVCDDDGNVCTRDCNPETGTCDYIPVEDETYCRFDGLIWLCMSGVCGEDPCDERTSEEEYQCPILGLEFKICCPGEWACRDNCEFDTCDSDSEEEYQCPISGLEHLFCCPYFDQCMPDCDF